jgi:non-ribosomal peptide synthetase-like protein
MIGLLYNPATFILAVLSKWLIIGKFKEGSYPLWGTYYFRWWLARMIQRIYPEHLISGTPLMPLYLRLMGAKVGKDCFIGTHQFGAFDLISVGAGTSIAQDCQVLGYSIENGYINFGKISVGKDCYVGTHSALCINSKMEDKSMIKEQSMIPSGRTIPAGEFWAGSPVAEGKIDNDLNRLSDKSNKVGILKRLFIGFLHILMLGMLELVSLLVLVQGFVLGIFYNKIPVWLFLASPLTAFFIILLTLFEIILLKRILMYRIKPGVYSTYSFYYVRKWAADNIVYISLQVLHTLYATLYTIPFLKALGAKIGKRVEVSTVTHISPELFEVGDGSFFADASMAGTPKVYNNHVIYDRIKIGSRTFIGNSAIVPISTDIGDDCLIGVMSIPPDKTKTENGTSWLGTPAMFLHKRDVNKDFSDKTTYNPSCMLYIKRLIIEFIRLVLPTSIYVISSYVLANVFSEISTGFYFWPAMLLMSAVVAAYEVFLILLVVLLKYSLIGTYRPCVHPLWSSFVWKTELVTGIYENLLGDYILTPLTGTPFLPVVLRLFGCRIGKKVFMDTIYVSEFDLVKIGRECAVNYNSTMQTHLFEDRVLKMSYLTIGNRATVGNGAVVLYDTYMEEGSKLGSSSLLMKGETLKAYTHWHGNPTCIAG